MVELFPTFLNTGTTNETFHQSGRHVKSSASMYESSGSQFFIITTGIQSVRDTFGESRFVKTYLTIFKVMK